MSESRETHLLSAPCTFILTTLEESSMSHQALNGAFAQYLADAGDHEISGLFEGAIETLTKLGLLEAFEDIS